ncbi:hypothetical protein ABGA98_25325, partial [Nonomuraea sp. B1E8]
GKVDALDGRVGSVETKVDALDGKVDALDGRVGSVETKVDALDAKVDAKFAETDRRLDKLESKVDGLQGTQLEMMDILVAIQRKLDVN